MTVNAVRVQPSSTVPTVGTVIDGTFSGSIDPRSGQITTGDVVGNFLPGYIFPYTTATNNTADKVTRCTGTGNECLNVTLHLVDRWESQNPHSASPPRTGGYFTCLPSGVMNAGVGEWIGNHPGANQAYVSMYRSDFVEWSAVGTCSIKLR